MSRVLKLITASLLLYISVSAQQAIELINPSFEGEAGVSTIPVGWYSCLSQDKQGPDTHTARSSVWRSRLKEMHGRSFVGLRVDSSGLVQSISTKLDQPLEANSYYEFSIDLAKPAKLLISNPKRIEEQVGNKKRRSRTSTREVTKPVILQLWGANSSCEFTELLVSTSPVYHVNWRKYRIRFQTINKLEYLHFVVRYIVETAYDGAIFLDNCSPIVRTDSLYTVPIPESSVNQLVSSYMKEKVEDRKKQRKRLVDEIYIKEDFLKSKKVDRSFIYDFSVKDLLTKYRVNRRGSREGEAITVQLSSEKELTRSFYKGNLLDGMQYHFYDNGENKAVLKFKKGVKTGIHTYYYPNGKVLIRVDWGEGEIIKSILELNNIYGQLIDVREFRKNIIQDFVIDEDVIKFYLPILGKYESFDLSEEL